MLDFRGYLLSEVHAQVLSHNPEFVIGYKANVWVVGSDSDSTSISSIAQTIKSQHSQSVPTKQTNNVTQLINWLQNLGDVIVARYDPKSGILSTHSSGRFQNRNLSPTNPMLPKMIKALQAAGLKVQTNFSTAPGQKQPEMGTVPKVVYHGTSTVSLGGILRYGLNPGKKTNWEVSHEDKVFVSAVFEEAQKHGDNVALKKKHDNMLKYHPFWKSAPILPVVVTFRVPDSAAISADYDVAQGAISDPKRSASNPYEQFDPKQIYFGQDAGRASQYAGSFAVLGRIGPQHIISVHVKDDNWREATAEELKTHRNQHSSETGNSEMPNKFLYQGKIPFAQPVEDDFGDEEDLGIGLTMGKHESSQPGFITWLKDRINKFSRQ
jgi:RNA:NAD 2'-phosphotransferase (TPT1/KptA family)